MKSIQMPVQFISIPRVCSFVALGLGILSYLPLASASDIKTSYAQERAACIQGHSNQDRATCLKEAAAAHAEAKRGNLDDKNPRYEENALMRCNALPKDDIAPCQRRIRGEGTVSGSVEGGGIYRELVVPVPTAPEASVPQDKTK